MVVCEAWREIGFPRQFKRITHRHLSTQHNLTLDEYCRKWPDAPLSDTRAKWMRMEMPVLEQPEEEVLSRLTDTQQRYIMARLRCNTKGAAARMIGISPTTPYNWKNRDVIEAMIGHLSVQPLLQAQMKIMQLAPKAIDVIEDVMESPDERLALYAAKDLADRAGLSRRGDATIDIRIYETMPTEQLEREIAKMLELEVIAGEFKEVDSTHP